MRPLTSYKGKVYDVSYNPMEEVYESVEEFINDIAKINIDIAKKDFPNTYQDDELYQRYTRLRDTQKISEQELKILLDAYDYEVVEKN